MSTVYESPEGLLRAFRAAVRGKIERDLALEAAESARRKADAIPKAREAVVEARGRGLCGAVWLFGSFAWGEPGARSDVDLLVERCADPFALASEVARHVGRDVHVVRVEDAPDSLRQRATTEGIPL